MGSGDGGTGRPPGERRVLKEALARTALDPDTRVRWPYRYIVAQVEQRYGQAPGSAETWDPEALMRALLYQRMEASVTTKKGRRGG